MPLHRARAALCLLVTVSKDIASKSMDRRRDGKICRWRGGRKVNGRMHVWTDGPVIEWLAEGKDASLLSWRAILGGEKLMGGWIDFRLTVLCASTSTHTLVLRQGGRGVMFWSLTRSLINCIFN